MTAASADRGRKPGAQASGPCGNNWFERQRMFLTDDSLCTVGGGCKKLRGRPPGWLDAGAMLLRPVVNGPQ